MGGIESQGQRGRLIDYFLLGTPECLGFSVGPPSVLVLVWDHQVSWFWCGTTKCLGFGVGPPSVLVLVWDHHVSWFKGGFTIILVQVFGGGATWIVEYL